MNNIVLYLLHGLLLCWTALHKLHYNNSYSQVYAIFTLCNDASHHYFVNGTHCNSEKWVKKDDISFRKGL